MNKLYVARDGRGQLVGRAEGWPFYMFANAGTIGTLFLRLRTSYSKTCSGWNEGNTEIIHVDSFYDGKGFSPPYEVK